MKIIVTDEVTGEGLALLRADPRIHLDIRLGSPRRPCWAASVSTTPSSPQRHHRGQGPAGRCHHLKIVARAGVGIDNVDVDYASARGVIVVNAPLGNTNSAAEHTLALLLAACRHVPAANASLKSGSGSAPNSRGSSSRERPPGSSVWARWGVASPCGSRPSSARCWAATLTSAPSGPRISACTWWISRNSAGPATSSPCILP